MFLRSDSVANLYLTLTRNIQRGQLTPDSVFAPDPFPTDNMRLEWWGDVRAAYPDTDIVWIAATRRAHPIVKDYYLHALNDSWVGELGIRMFKMMGAVHKCNQLPHLKQCIFEFSVLILVVKSRF